MSKTLKVQHDDIGQAWRLEDLTMNLDKMFSKAPSGCYRVEFHDMKLDPPRRRKRGTTYLMTIRFKVLAGPRELGNDGAPHWPDIYAGRLLGIWHDLEPDANGIPGISPNWGLADAVNAAQGRTVFEKVESWARSVKLVGVEYRPKFTSKIVSWKADDDPTTEGWHAVNPTHHLDGADEN